EGSELAAVLVEPRQSRRPDLETKEFLLRLREVTERHGIALIFDEVVTGFRLHPGGIQALYGLQADITTYGKAIGNGMPIGVVAGKATYLDAIDGGHWRFGDDSWPEEDTTFFAGTFFRHPLVMAGALAVLEHLEEQGPELQRELSRRTAEFSDRLNAFFEQEALPIQVKHYGSLFLFAFPRELREMELFFAYLLERGVYIWERRICYLSTAHTDEDLDQVFQAVRDSIREMQRGGFLPTPEPAETEAFPLTEGQRELWAFSQLDDKASLAYNGSYALRLRGQLRVGDLQHAVQQVVDRHEALRATFSPTGDGQSFSAHSKVDIEVEDLAANQLEARLAAEVRRSFDLVRGPLLRSAILRLAETDHVLLLTVHHLVADGYSVGLLIGEIAELYAAACAGRPPELAKPARYRDYVRSLTANPADATATEAYWSEQLSGGLPRLEVPTDHPRRGDDFDASREVLKIDATTTARLAERAQGEGASLAMLLTASLVALLHRLSGQRDLLLGLTSAGQAVEDRYLVGHCVTVLPLRSQPHPQQRFADLLRQVKHTLLDAYEHQNFSLNRLLKKLQPRHDPSQPAVLSTIFNFEQAGSPLEWPDLEIERLGNQAVSTQWDLAWTAVHSPAGVRLECRYRSHLFEPSTIQRWLGDLQGILRGICHRPESSLEALSRPAAQAPRSSQHNHRSQELEIPSIHSLFEDWAERTPTAPAVRFEDHCLTYRELDERASRLAQHLRSQGVGPEARVGLCAERSLEMVVAVLGVLKAGAAYVPLEPQFPRERILTTLEDSGATMLLTFEADRAAELGSRHMTVVDLGDDALSVAGDGASSPTPELSGHLAYVVYTSGSTGKPKGVAVEHRQLISYVDAVSRQLELPAGAGFATVSTLAADL
ncbi:MAG: aminotransferase class III-fold pyridoxal phosphate-dependent enzyme, partial [Acidobacteriota bacterium]